MPTGVPWQKGERAVSAAEDRYLMAVIATASNPRFAVSRVDVDAPFLTANRVVGLPVGCAETTILVYEYNPAV